MTRLAIVDHFDMSGEAGLFKEALGDGALVSVDEVVELPAEKVAGVDSDQVEERGLPFRVTDRL